MKTNRDKLEKHLHQLLDSLDYAAWEHGFRSSPGGYGDSPHTQTLEKDRKFRLKHIKQLISEVVHYGDIHSS